MPLLIWIILTTTRHLHVGLNVLFLLAYSNPKCDVCFEEFSFISPIWMCKSAYFKKSTTYLYSLSIMESIVLMFQCLYGYIEHTVVGLSFQLISSQLIPHILMRAHV